LSPGIAPGNGFGSYHLMKLGELGSSVSASGTGTTSTVTVNFGYCCRIHQPASASVPRSVCGTASAYASSVMSVDVIMNRRVVTTSVKGRPSSSSASTVRGNISSIARMKGNRWSLRASKLSESM
jgi:hypothetical protein